MSASINQVIKIILKQPIKIISNPWVTITSLMTAFGSLIINSFSDFFLNNLKLSVASLNIIILVLSAIALIYGIWGEAQKYHIYTRQSLGLPIVINVSNPASSINALKSICKIIESETQDKNYLHNLSKYLNISQESLIFEYRGDICDREKLKFFLKITRYNLEKLNSQTPGNTKFYLAYIGPISVSILVGALLKTYGVKIFQYNKSSDNYLQVIDIIDRKIHTKVEEFSKFDVNMPDKKCKKAVVVIEISSHKPNLKDKKITNSGDIIYLHSKNKSGTIAKDEDWLKYSREIFTVLNNYCREYQEIKLVYSMPVSLGIALGIAIQNCSNLILTNYERETDSYKDLIKINEINYNF